MSHRQTTNTAGQITYPAGNSGATGTLNTYYSLSSSKIVAFNGHAVEVSADNSVWDTVLNRYLFPGTEFNVVP